MTSKTAVEVNDDKINELGDLTKSFICFIGVALIKANGRIECLAQRVKDKENL